MSAETNNFPFKHRDNGVKDFNNCPKIYFSYHHRDFVYFEHICATLFKKYKCVFYYYDYEESGLNPNKGILSSYLTRFDLIIVPVTANFLHGSNNAFDFELPFAIENHISILPLLMDANLAREFDIKCNHLQYLKEDVTDITALSFDEKLDRFLSGVIVSDEVRKRAKEAFDAKMFLSYRKKDREYAQELMKMIHQNKSLLGLAIWYDEFLNTGEPWDEGIQEELKTSDIFTLLVTPNLINEDNFVRRKEYPMAKEIGKPILPMESIPTDRRELELQYEQIPVCLDAHNAEEVANALLHLMEQHAKPKERTPKRTYYLGLAYLSGICVETNFDIGFKLISEAAEGNYYKAQKKLISLYDQPGTGCNSYVKALEWQRRVVENLRSMYENHQEDTRIAIRLGEERIDLCKRIKALEDSESKKEERRQLVRENIQFLRKQYENEPEAFADVLADALMLGAIEYLKSGNYSKSIDYYTEIITVRKKIAQDESVTSRLKLLKSYNEICYTIKPLLPCRYKNKSLPNGYPEEYKELRSFVENYYKTAIEHAEAYFQKDRESYWEELDNNYYDLGHFYYDFFYDDAKAVECHAKELQMLEDLTKENPQKYGARLATRYSVCKKDPSKETEYLDREIALTELLAEKMPQFYSVPLIEMVYQKAGSKKGKEEEYLQKSIQYTESYKDYPKWERGEVYKRAGKYYWHKDPQKAEYYFKRAIEEQEELGKEYPHLYENGGSTLVAGLSSVACTYIDLGDLYIENKREEDAEAAYKKGIQLDGKSATTYIKIGDIRFRKKDYKTAEEYYIKAVEVNKQEDPRYLNEMRRRLSNSYNRIITFYESLKEEEKQIVYIIEAIALDEQLIEKNPQKFLANLASYYLIASRYYDNRKDYASEEKYCLNAIRVIESLVNKGKNEYQEKLAYSYSLLGHCYCKLQNYDGAEEYYSKSFELYSDLCTSDLVRFKDSYLQSYGNLLGVLKIKKKRKEYWKLRIRATKSVAAAAKANIKSANQPKP